MKLALHWKIIIGLILGVVVGLAINSFYPELQASFAHSDQVKATGNATADFIANLILVLGDLFKRALQFIAAPIIFLMMVLAVGSLGDLRTLGRIGGKTIGIFACTAVLSVIVGLLLVNTIKPGGPTFISDQARATISAGVDPNSASKLTATAKDTKPWNLIREFMPTNPFDSLARGDTLQIVVFAVLLGIALSLLPKDVSKPVIDCANGLAEAFTSIVRGIMKLAPYGVFCLVLPIIAKTGWSVVSGLGAYCGTVILGLAVIQFVIYPAVVVIFSGMSVVTFFRGITQVQLVAFSSSSSAATLPVTIANVRDKLGVPADITGFVCAMGAKINMDGTALMQAVATVFLAQFYGNELSLGQQATMVITAVVAAIGSPGIPSGGMVMLVIVLQTYGVNPAGIAMILAVDRILDMCRTIVNVTGDAAVAVAVAGLEGRLGKVEKGTVE